MAQSGAVFNGPQEPPLLEWNFSNFVDVLSSRYGERVAVSSPYQGARWTYNDLRDKTRELAARLAEGGIEPGDRVLLLASNGVEFIQIFFATVAIGAVAVLAGANLSTAEWQEAVRTVEPRCIFVSQRIGFRSNLELLGQTASTFTNGPIVVIGGGPSAKVPVNFVSFDAFLAGSTAGGRCEDASSPGSSLDQLWGKSPPTTPCCFQFTSGTTGARKASMLSHSNLINNANLVGYQLQLSDSDKLCCCPPLSHCFGLVCGLLASCLHGGTLVIPSEIFNPAVSLKTLREEACTVVHAVPSMFEALLSQEKKRQIEGASGYKLRTGIIAGSAPPHDLLCALEQHLGLGALLYPFGMTELSAVCLCTSINDSLIADNTSVGTAMPHTSVKLISATGETLPADSPGELCVRGYLVHLGYFRNEAKTKEAWHLDDSGKQWLRTGDLAMLDRNGKCKIIGRSKDIIKKHGENIAPKDIEEILMAHSSVAKAAVIGVPHQKHGESVVAFVELNSRGSLDEQGLKSWLRQQKLSPHKMPDYFLPVGDVDGALAEIPLNTSGKVLKTDLRAFAQVSLKAR